MNVLHKNKMDARNLNSVSSKIKSQRKEATRKLDQKTRKFLTIQVCRKDLNPYIKPPMLNKKGSGKKYCCQYRAEENMESFETEERIKKSQEPVTFPPIDDSSQVLCNYLEDTITYKSEPQAIEGESQAEEIVPSINIEEPLNDLSDKVNIDKRNNSSDAKDSSLPDHVPETPKKNKLATTLQTIAEETKSNLNLIECDDECRVESVLEVSKEEVVNDELPFKFEREITRAEYKHLKAKFRGLRNAMLERKQAQASVFTKKQPINENGHFLLRLPSVQNKCLVQQNFHHNPHSITTSSLDRQSDNYNKFIDRISLELPPHATQKLAHFKSIITDTETTDQFKSRLLEKNRRLIGKIATEDQRWLSFVDTMKKDPIVLWKYRQKVESEEVKEEPYHNKLRFFAATNWMG